MQAAGATGSRCTGSLLIVECDVSLPGSSSEPLVIPVRWDGPGQRPVSVRVRLASSQPDDAGFSTSATVSVYLLALNGLRTSPPIACAGRRLVATATLVRSDTRSPLTSHSLSCPAVIAALAHSQPSSRFGEPLCRDGGCGAALA
jgi:hypothetical protein